MSLTSANAVIMLAVPGIFSSPQQLQGFSADDIFDVEQIAIAETMMGVDGILSAGMVFNKTTQNITLQSDSASIAIFDTWIQQTLADVELTECSGVILVSGIGMQFTMPKGYLTHYPPMPSLGTTVKPRKYTIDWETVIPSPI